MARVMYWVPVCGPLLLGLSLAGCGGGSLETYPVTGKVTLPDGSPLAGARVIFDCAEKKVKAEGKTQADGTYTLATSQENAGAVAGSHRVIVMGPPRMVASAGGEEEGAVTEDPTVPKIHPKYQSYDQSGLAFTVEPKNDNVYDITVELAP